MASCYIVFPCPQCKKFTYAKKNQKIRVCGVCNSKINVEKIATFEEAQNVAQAHKLTQSKNVGWLAKKGIYIQSEVKISREFSKKTKYLQENSSHANIIKNLVETVIKMIQSKCITDLHTVADPYLQIFFKSSHPPADLTFQEFKRAFLSYIQSR